MAEGFLGTGVIIPDINITGWLANTWFYIAIIVILGIILIVTLVLVFFYMTYNKKIVFFENISGLGFQVVRKSRARSLKVSTSGEELLKLIGGSLMSAYGRKMGKNTYWYAKGEDGYWYNFVLGDLDAKMAILDVEPIDKDVRMFHVATARINQNTYGKTGFWEKHGQQVVAFIFLFILIIGMWILIGQIKSAATSLAKTSETNAQVAKTIAGEITAYQNIKNQNSGITGLVPVGS